MPSISRLLKRVFVVRAKYLAINLYRRMSQHANFSEICLLRALISLSLKAECYLENEYSILSSSQIYAFS